MTLQDVIIIGGGPAGLNAAVVLGRARRKVILFDTGQQRNLHSHGIHNYLTRDNIQPAEFLNAAAREVRKYGVRIIKQEIVFAESLNRKHFIVRDKAGNKYQSKKLLVATGLKDKIPSVEGFIEFYGKSVFHCPYCDAWEVRDKKIGVYARNKNGFELAISLRTWSDKITYYTDGYKFTDSKKIKVLKQYRIPVVSKKIKRLSGKKSILSAIEFSDDTSIPCEAIFFANGYLLQSHLAEMLGCNLTKKKAVVTNRFQQTNIPGLYVAGDASKDMHFVVVAAAEGAKAGVIINKELQNEERSRFLK